MKLLPYLIFTIFLKGFYFLSLVTEENLRLSATRNRGNIVLLYYNTLSATRKILRRRFFIVVKASPLKDVTRRGTTK